MSKPATKALVEATGISPGYASMILNDSDDPKLSRTPPRALAIRIFRGTGWKHPSIADLTDEQISVLETVDPWIPPKDRAPAQDAA